MRSVENEYDLNQKLHQAFVTSVHASYKMKIRQETLNLPKMPNLNARYTNLTVIMIGEST